MRRKKYKVIVLQIAKEEIREAARWYRSKQKNLGRRFRLAVESKLKRIGSEPHMGSSPYKGIRWIGVEKFPYQIHYYVNDANETVIVTTVFATARNPFWE